MTAFADGPPGHPRAVRRRPGRAWPPAGEGPRRGHPAARAHAHPGRQRRVREAQPIVRADDDARPACAGRGARIRFRFPGKSGKRHEVGLSDRRLAAVVRRCQDLPGQDLFQYLDADGEVHDVTSDDVNGYLREISGQDFTAKDFRTWAGTVLAFRALRALRPPEGAADARHDVAEAMRVTADRLGNTPAVARNSYVHPAVIDAFMDGSIGDALVEATEDAGEAAAAATDEETDALITLVGDRLAADAGRADRRRSSRRSR